MDIQNAQIDSPLIIGLTGGIGSGKTTFSKFFSTDGFAVYNSDLRAKSLMKSNIFLRKELVKAFGEKVYENDELNRTYLAKIIFDDKSALNKINTLVHPVVNRDFLDWHKAQKGKFIIKEAAILFESGAYKSCDYVILVTADKKTRISRVVNRDNLNKEEVLKRMSKQWDEDKKKQLADFCIDNNSDLVDLKLKYTKLMIELNKII